jgi:hypothetical protein
LECTRREACPNEDEDGIVYLQYHSVKLPFALDDCRQMHDLAVEASKRLHELRSNGFFANRERVKFFYPPK